MAKFSRGNLCTLPWLNLPIMVWEKIEYISFMAKIRDGYLRGLSRDHEFQ